MLHSSSFMLCYLLKERKEKERKKQRMMKEKDRKWEKEKKGTAWSCAVMALCLRYWVPDHKVTGLSPIMTKLPLMGP